MCAATLSFERRLVLSRRVSGTGREDTVSERPRHDCRRADAGPGIQRMPAWPSRSSTGERLRNYWGYDPLCLLCSQDILGERARWGRASTRVQGNDPELPSGRNRSHRRQSELNRRRRQFGGMPTMPLPWLWVPVRALDATVSVYKCERRVATLRQVGIKRDASDAQLNASAATVGPARPLLGHST